MSELGIFYPNMPSGGGEVVVYPVTITRSGNRTEYTIDATPSMIEAALENGKNVYISISVDNPIGASPMLARFQGSIIEEAGEGLTITILSFMFPYFISNNTFYGGLTLYSNYGENLHYTEFSDS